MSVGRIPSATDYCGREQTNFQMKKKLRKDIGTGSSSNCITRHVLTGNPEWKKERRPRDILHRELEADIKRINSKWKQLGRIVHNRSGWRILVGKISQKYI
ncbi:unnamed protein product [Schistosoma mattheei]|uniref:Uncharacterized protein n=1 Tax=Schistosoma mattheei TaxID=31246 RepID=A0A183PZV4_9TREM|nr:unnamed protein product [Schistosoma mattheei]